MRATEAMWLSDPATELTEENKALCTHIDVTDETTRDAIKNARRINRLDKKQTLFD